MIFDVPVAYHAYGKVNGARISSSVGFVEVVPFDIPELTDDAAPIAASWDDASPEYASVPSFPYVGKDHVRVHEGQFLRPTRAFEIVTGMRDPLSMVDAADLGRILAKSLMLGLEKHQNANTKRGRVPSEHFGNVDRSSRDFAVREVGKVLSSYRVVDGIVYEKCSQPVVVILSQSFSAAEGDDVFRRNGRANTHYRQWSSHVLRVTTMDRAAGVVYQDAFLTIANFKEALKRVRRMNVSVMMEKDAINAFNEARRPELSEFYMADEFQARAEECAMYLRFFVARVEERRKDLLPTGDSYRLRLFCDLADAIGLLPEAEGFDLLETAGRAYLERYEEYAEHLHPEQVALKRAVSLAENRPVFFDTMFAADPEKPNV